MVLPKKIVASLIIASLSAPLAYAFDDVAEDHEHFASITWMRDEGVIQGYDDGTFRPTQSVNRAEALKIILLASDIDVLEGEPPFEGENLFSDVTVNDWFYPYVDKAVEFGIVGGYPDGSFKPGQNVNNAELLKMIILANNIHPGGVSEAPYEDVPEDAWFASFVKYAKEKNLVKAKSDGYFHPGAAAPRATVAEVMYRVAYMNDTGKTAYPLSLNWPTYQHPSQPYSFRVPFGWQVLEGVNGEAIVWRRDYDHGQQHWARTTPHSAAIAFGYDTNGGDRSVTDFFNEVRLGEGLYDSIYQDNTTTAENRLTLVVEDAGAERDLRDLYLSMPENDRLVVHSTYGTGRLGPQLELFVHEIHSTIAYSLPPPPPILPEEAAAQARENIQTDGQGNAILDLFEDRELIETDTIGIGTGPVDYYYSAWADVTLKYERSLDVILDVMNGRTTAF